MRTTNAWKYLLCFSCSLVLISCCGPEQQKPPVSLQKIKAVRDSGNIYDVTTMASSDTPGGQGVWSAAQKMVLATPDCTDCPCFPENILFVSDTGGGHPFSSDTSGGQ